MTRKLSSYDKCKRYLTMIAKQFGGEIIQSETTNSVYFKLQGSKIRLSDHISMNACNNSGMVSIIVPSNLSDEFILQVHGNGRMSILNYNRIREIVRTFSEIPVAFERSSVMNYAAISTVEHTKNCGLSVLGVPANCFSDNQMRGIRNTAKKVASQNNINIKF